MLRVKGWGNFQHYKERRPPWIKLSRELLENYDWYRLQDASKALAVTIWLLAAENDDPKAGTIKDDPEWLGFRARMDPKTVISCIKDLIKHGFIEQMNYGASDLLAPCYQDAIPETETETETETEIIARKKSKKPKPKVSLDELSIDHIAPWLETKRVGGVYLTIDEHALLEIFKDYCYAKNPKYTDYVAAFRNAFTWNNAPLKGQSHETNRHSRSTGNKTDRAKAAIQRGIDAIPGPGTHPDQG